MLEQLQSVPPWLVMVAALAAWIVALAALPLIGRAVNAVTALLNGPLSRA
ncbi:MAG: hypothetical protein GVY13_18720 [Alphaproteobacteria bacterium]|jgi:hypothetical protein|nr:hypothetical protein [Alphaproteobacteria bacterium]